MLKNKRLSVVKPPQTCSWYWRKLLKLRSMARGLVKHNVGNGKNTYLWHDNWHPLGPLLERFGSKILYDTALPNNALIADIIHESNWDMPTAIMLELNAIEAVMSEVPTPNDERDTLTWCVSPDGTFNLRHTWEHFQADNPKVLWYDLVWKAGGIPMHAFIVWLPIQNKLSTHDRIFMFT